MHSSKLTECTLRNICALFYVNFSKELHAKVFEEVEMFAV